MTTTITTPAWIDEDEHYVASLVVDAAAATVFSFIGARANYTLRVVKRPRQVVVSLLLLVGGSGL